MKKTPVCPQKERGAALVVILIVTVAMLLISTPFLFKLSGQYRSADSSFKSLAALNLAEAGVERAIWELNYGDITAWDGDSTLRTLTLFSVDDSSGNPVGDVVIRVLDAEGDNPAVESMGRVVFSGSTMIEKTVRAELEWDGPAPAFDYALFGTDEVKFDDNLYGAPDIIVDSYDSRLGDYEPWDDEEGTNRGWDGHIGTNSTIDDKVTLSQEGFIYGNIDTGFESIPDDVIDQHNVIILGNKQALSEPKDLGGLNPPKGLTYAGDYTVQEGFVNMISEDMEFNDLEIKENGKLVISGDVVLYVNDDFIIKSNAQIEILDGASLMLYVGHKFSSNNTSQFNNLSRDPTKFIICGTRDFDSSHDVIGIRSATDFYGGVFLPRAKVKFFTDIHIFGSVIAKEIQVISKVFFHFDTAFLDLDPDVWRYRLDYWIKSWQEIQ